MSSQQRTNRGLRSYTLPNNDSNDRKRDKSRNKASRSKTPRRTEKYNAKHSAHPKLQLSNRSQSRSRKAVESHRKERTKAPAFRLVANQNRKEVLVPPLVT